MNVQQALNSFGYVELRYPTNLALAVAQAMNSWQMFCGLPLEQKNQYSTGHRIRDFGYMLRQDTGKYADKKELFHVSRRDLPRLQACSTSVSSHETDFIEFCDELINACQPVVMQFAAAVSREYDLPGFERLVDQSADDWTFRFLHYYGDTTLAHPHIDRGGFTLHLSETEAGGECLGFDDIWRPWPALGDKTIIFPSLVLQHYSQCLIKALWHQVRANQPSDTKDRYAIVAFIDFQHTHRFNDGVYRTQNLLPGTTYYMQMSDFEAFFEERC